MLGLAACGGDSVAEAPVESAVETPSDIPEVSPTPSPTPSKKEEPTDKSSVDEVTALREMPLDAYLELSAKEREPLIQAMLEQSKDWTGEFGEGFIDGDESDLYKYNPIDISSKDNSAEEIAMQHLYWMQLALMQTKDLDTTGTFDPDIASKALAGGFTRSSYISNDGNESLVDGNEVVTYWLSGFESLGTVTSHNYAQKAIGAEFVNQSTINDSKSGMKHSIVTVEFATEPLPETLVDGFKEGTAVFHRLSFVWNEDVGRWLHYAGIPQNQQPGWKP